MQGKAHLLTLIWIPLTALTWLLTERIWITCVPFLAGAIAAYYIISKGNKESK